MNAPILLYMMNIRKLIKDDEFVNSMNDLESCTWTLFIDVVKNLLRNCWVENYWELVEKFLKNIQDTDANMSIQVYVLHSHRDKFPDNCSNVSDEQEE